MKNIRNCGRCLHYDEPSEGDFCSICKINHKEKSMNWFESKECSDCEHSATANAFCIKCQDDVTRPYYEQKPGYNR